ncbi:hypothetical protein PHMEG_0006861 [Phytophthora megakarya]|uniref:Myb-like domain-containing protein n=1 Tax=Phytophthora megakarya TaxID=4795 RepID=A0A225WNS9_9STRA|nr:hypothetical protein PHMEG_0006861 [Phytophthora megakarya]
MADDEIVAPNPESDALNAETDADTIATRTRTKFSLVDVAVETEEDREYQRFLSSLLPNEQVNLSFLDEEDEEYRPEEEEDEQEDEDARRGISKKELTDLLLDSTHMTFPKLSATAIPAMLRGRPEAVTQAQCIQLASQMHKHLQLLLQTYHLLASKPPTPELAECRTMIEELQHRGEKALQDKNALLSKLNPAMTGSSVGSTSGIETPSGSDTAESEGNSGNASTSETLLASRRVTRSLTAAHAAVAHPSMFELVGSQTVDELAAGFARGCSLDERDRAIQEQMLQLDTHLISAKKRRKSKKGYSTTEDVLLAHGAKRFGTQTDSWERIQKDFLPTKTTQNLRHRFKYLLSPKTGMNAVKALHLKTPLEPHNNSWLLEEDVRIARGLVELHKEKYHFAHLAKKYLPHRSRLEIRKRWERLGAKFRSDLAEIGLTAPDEDSIELAVSMKEYLEDKLRNRMMRQKGEAERAKLDAALQLHLLRQGMRNTRTVESMSVASCKTKNLHPALFFSSWSFINPAMLLNSTCKHNWPSFMNEDTDGKDKLQRNPLNAGETGNGIIQSEYDEEDDSDYEHDELLSSENEESDSDFEQMEFMDDDEIDEDRDGEVNADTIEQESFIIPSPRTRHPLRLQNLDQPDNERMKRALAALERRIVGKSVNDSATSSGMSSHNGPMKREKRKVVSTLVAPLGANQTANAFQVDIAEPALATTTTIGIDAVDGDNDDAWEDGSGNEEFEVAKLQQCPICRHTTCKCSSSERMQLLLRRMKEKRSSSSLQ